MANDKSPWKFCESFFRMVVTEVTQLRTLQYVQDEEMADFLASYVQSIRRALDEPCPIETLRVATDFFARFWGFCNHLSLAPQRRSAVFEKTIGKLEMADMVMCLWVFTAVATACTKGGDEELCVGMETEVSLRMSRFPDNESRALIVAIMVLRFLSHTCIDGFSEVLIPLMNDYYGCTETYEMVCTALGKQDDFSRQKKIWENVRKDIEGKLKAW